MNIKIKLFQPHKIEISTYFILCYIKDNFD